MEYTMARAVMAVCGVLILAAVLPPVTTVYDDGESSCMEEQTEQICRMLDSFQDSEADEMMIRLDTVLPNDCSVSMNGHIIRVINGEREYVRGTEADIEADRPCYDRNDCVKFTKDGTTIILSVL